MLGYFCQLCDSFINLLFEKQNSHFCSDLSWGGRNYILKWFFFVQTIFAHRYIHRRELRLVSLESSSSVEYAIKKILLYSFFTGSYLGLNFWETWSEFRCFYSHFPEFLPKISSILLKYAKILNNSDVNFIFKDKKYCRLDLFKFFVKNFWLIVSKISLFHQKQHGISFFSPLWINLPEIHPETPLIQSLQTQMRAIPTSNYVESAL